MGSEMCIRDSQRPRCDCCRELPHGADCGYAWSGFHSVEGGDLCEQGPRRGFGKDSSGLSEPFSTHRPSEKIAFLYEHRPDCDANIWYMSPYEFMIYWRVEPATYRLPSFPKQLETIQRSDILKLPEAQQLLRRRLRGGLRTVDADGLCLFHCLTSVCPQADVAMMQEAAGCPAEEWGTEEHLELLACALGLRVEVWPIELSRFDEGLKRDFSRPYGPCLLYTSPSPRDS